MLNYEDARALVFQHVIPLEKCTRPLTEAQGLALSEDILAPHGMPSFDNSGVDGYALQAEDLSPASAGNPVVSFGIELGNRTTGRQVVRFTIQRPV